jgi:hypothetical protein
MRKRFELARFRGSRTIQQEDSVHSVVGNVQISGAIERYAHRLG